MLYIRNSALNMAGNIVKWWKHKILRGYKQFSVQECATDSEELMCHDVRTSSSCSAPPDLLVLNDREFRFLHSSETKKPFTAKQTIPMTEARSFTSQPDNCTFDGHVHNHPKILQPPPPLHNDLITVINNNNNNIKQSHNHQQQQQQQFHSMATKMPDETSQQDFFFQDQQNHHHVVRDEQIRLEEFSCDVSVEGGGKSSQPLQFSFTFYDLDGHHGKITKDDIVGIVYTIYESIGKSVVVPHCGSKTINVRLTFSPEGKPKSTCHPHKHKQSPASGEGGGKLKPSPRLVPTAKTNFAQPCRINNRRAHRYRPRKLIKSDDEDDDSTSDKKEDNGIPRHSTKAKPSVQNSKFMEKQQYYQQPNNNNNNHEHKLLTTNSQNNNNHNTGENASIRKMNETCTECTVMAEAIKCAESVTPAKSCQCQKTCTDSCIKCAVIPRLKANKKYRKYKDYAVSRPRSLSAGNDANWKYRQLQSKPWCPEPPYAAESMHNSPNIVQSCTGGKVQQDNVRMLTKSNSNSNSLECWKTTFSRNELISIIRKSMEKNRLCFQATSKPYANGYLAAHNNNFYQSVQPNGNKQVPVVQLKTRRRSNTTSKIPTLIANHTSMYGGNNSYYMKKSINIHEHHNRRIHNSTPSHVPLPTPTQVKKNSSMNALYGRKSSKNLNSSSITATTNNTTAADGHNSKANLCGYDSFLHATICGSENMHKQTVNSKAIGDTINQNPFHDQPIAAVKPIMSPIYNRAKIFPCSPNKVNQYHKTKNNKIMHYNNNNNNNNNNQSYPITIATTQNTPQCYGYQRLSSTNKHNLAALNLISPNTEKSNLQYLEKCRKAQLKNYDQLLYAKLSEKLQQTNMTESSVESQKGIRKQLKRFDANQTKQINHGQINAKDNDYMSVIVGGDPLECQHLISQTSDEENQSQTELNDKKMQVKFENMIRNKLELQGKHEMENEQSVCKGKSNGILLVDEDIQTHSKINRSEASHSNEDDCKEAATVAASTNTPVSSGSNTSSLIHRYVHEHIHHHYHHFEDKEQ